MSEQHKDLTIIISWIEKAENDLRNAEHTLSMEKNCPFDTVCFHAQQCAEKYLKGLLVSVSADFPKTHDLRLLLQLARLKVPIDVEMKRLLVLNRYPIEARCPGEWEPITRSEAEEAVKIAREVRKSIRRHIPQIT
ncbi:MAG: HEPN domain-containing protein [Deltaproteobacteria bacterium]|nr:HEPN domain-containing protein [Deltaproteobacteria bacterium]